MYNQDFIRNASDFEFYIYTFIIICISIYELILLNIYIYKSNLTPIKQRPFILRLFNRIMTLSIIICCIGRIIPEKMICGIQVPFLFIGFIIPFILDLINVFYIYINYYANDIMYQKFELINKFNFEYSNNNDDNQNLLKNKYGNLLLDDPASSLSSTTKTSESFRRINSLASMASVGSKTSKDSKSSIIDHKDVKKLFNMKLYLNLYLNKFVILITILIIIITFLSFWLIDNNIYALETLNINNCLINNNIPYIIIILITGLLKIPIMIFIIISMKKVEDNFYMKEEFYSLLKLNIIYVIIIAILLIPNIYQLTINNEFMFYELILIIFTFLTSYINLLQPILLTLKPEFNNPIISNNITLKNVFSKKNPFETTTMRTRTNSKDLAPFIRQIKDIDNFVNFMEGDYALEFAYFLLKEFNVESLLFWKKVKIYKYKYKYNSSFNSKRACLKLYNEFILEKSPNQININFTTLNKIKKKITEEKYSIDIFDDAAAETLDLLYLDAFKRYKRQCLKTNTIIPEV